MAQPTYLASGNTARRTDTRLILKAKQLGALQDSLASPDAANDPKRTDTYHRLHIKITRAQAGA